MEPFEDLEVDSVVDLQLPVDVDVSIGIEMVGEQRALGSVAGSGVEPLHGAAARDPGVAGAYCAGGCPRVMQLALTSVTSICHWG